MFVLLYKYTILQRDDTAIRGVPGSKKIAGADDHATINL